jgi:cytochrome P450
MVARINRADGEFDTALDLHGPEFREHNYELMADLQAKCPVALTSAWDRQWLITGYDEVFEAAHDTELFSNGMAKAVPAAPYEDPLVPIDLDPPLVTAYRRVLLPALSPHAAKAAEPALRALASELIDNIIERGQGDLAQDVFTPLPARWTLQILGIDDADWRTWIGWVHKMIHGRTEDAEGAAASGVELGARIYGELERRRSQRTEDLLMTMIDAEVLGQKMTDVQLIGMVTLFLFGGMDTTAGLTGNSMLRILSDDRLRRRYVEDPTRIERDTEEFLRHGTPALGLQRVITRDAEFHGKQLKQADHVVLMYSAANRDPSVFEEPTELNFDRRNNRHLSFAVGVHRCLGSNFARVMFQVMITEVLRRMPDVEHNGPWERYPDSADVFAVRRLPVRFTPGTRESASTRAYPR